MKLDTIVEGNPSEGRTLYQGLAKLMPVAVNPTKEELGKLLGTEVTRDITYENGDNYRLDIWCKEVTVDRFLKFSIFINNNDVSNKAGDKNQFINAFGRTGYYPSKEAILEKNQNETEDWRKFKTEGLRIAKTGEATLYDFLINLYNAAPTKPFPVLDSFQKLTLGSVKELKDVIADAYSKKRIFHALTGVKDGKYQDIWTGMFLPSVFTQKREQAFYRKASDTDYPYKADWGDSLAFREFSPEPAPEGLEVESQAGSPNSEVSDDLPW